MRKSKCTYGLINMVSLNCIIRKRIWLIFTFFFFLNMGRRLVDRHFDRVNVYINNTGWTALNEIIRNFHHFCCWDGKRGATPHRLTFTPFTVSISLPDLLFHWRADSQTTFLFSHRPQAQWIEMWFWDKLYKYWKLCKSPPCSQGFYQIEREKFDFFFFFLLGLQSFSRDTLRFNDTVRLSAVQLCCTEFSGNHWEQQGQSRLTISVKFLKGQCPKEGRQIDLLLSILSRL